MKMPRHPFESISPRYSLATLLLAMTFVGLAVWLLTFDIGRIILGLVATIAFLLLAIACWSWILGTFGEPQRQSHGESRDSPGDVQ